MRCPIAQRESVEGLGPTEQRSQFPRLTMSDHVSRVIQVIERLEARGSTRTRTLHQIYDLDPESREVLLQRARMGVALIKLPTNRKCGLQDGPQCWCDRASGQNDYCLVMEVPGEALELAGKPQASAQLSCSVAFLRPDPTPPTTR